MKKVKTNAVRILERQKISFETGEYEVDLNDLSAPNVAKKIGMPLERVFKTLVANGDKNGILMACIPGGDELDMKKLAAVSGNKRVEMIHLKDVLAVTGYVRGGVSPIGAKKAYPVYIDDSVMSWESIAVSAGMRGHQIIIAPADIIKATNAAVAGITHK